MQQTLFTAMLAVVIIFILLYRWKKRAENKMGNDLNALIESNRFIPMGGWNECPEAEEHMAIAKYWYEKYGAAVACISNDIIQYRLPQPIAGDTMLLAEEHLGYCEDVLQGDNLASLASLIKKSTVWYFWWD